MLSSRLISLICDTLPFQSLQRISFRPIGECTAWFDQIHHGRSLWSRWNPSWIDPLQTTKHRDIHIFTGFPLVNSSEIISEPRSSILSRGEKGWEGFWGTRHVRISVMSSFLLIRLVAEPKAPRIRVGKKEENIQNCDTAIWVLEYCQNPNNDRTSWRKTSRRAAREL